MRARALLAALALALPATTVPAAALVTVTHPDDPLVFFRLFRPTGQFDETSLSGFEFLISSREGEFRAADHYLVSGEATEEATSLASDLGAAGDLSGVTFAFSIRHQLEGGRHFAFRLEDPPGSRTSVLCWGQGCPPGSLSAGILGGIPPIDDYNGLQLQVRAQDVAGSSAAVTIHGLAGVDVAGAPFFDEVVTPDSPGTIPGDAGRRGQWMLGDSLDLVLREWELTGEVTLSRPDAALSDVTMVRLAVDLVRDPSLAYVPEPSLAALAAAALATLAALAGPTRAPAGCRGSRAGSRGPRRSTAHPTIASGSRARPPPRDRAGRDRLADAVVSRRRTSRAQWEVFERGGRRRVVAARASHAGSGPSCSAR